MHLLELKDLVNKPVRNLLTWRAMKMEIVGALLHRPKVLFLDEPTIGAGCDHAKAHPYIY